MEEVWVNFDNNSYSILKEVGYKFFLFHAEYESDGAKLYPFKSVADAILKQQSIPKTPNQSLYIMNIGEILDDLADEIPLLEVSVLI